MMRLGRVHRGYHSVSKVPIPTEDVLFFIQKDIFKEGVFSQNNTVSSNLHK